jgi:hypothetical protein
MYRVIIHVASLKGVTKYQFMRRDKRSARQLAEELPVTGFWVPRVRPKTFMPPSRIKLIKLESADSKGS